MIALTTGHYWGLRESAISTSGGNWRRNLFRKTERAGAESRDSGHQAPGLSDERQAEVPTSVAQARVYLGPRRSPSSQGAPRSFRSVSKSCFGGPSHKSRGPKVVIQSTSLTSPPSTFFGTQYLATLKGWHWNFTATPLPSISKISAAPQRRGALSRFAVF